MIGKLVVVNLRFSRASDTAMHTNLVAGLPKPKYTNVNYIAGSSAGVNTTNGVPVYIAYDTNRTVIRSSVNISGGVSYLVSFFYIAA